MRAKDSRANEGFVADKSKINFLRRNIINWYKGNARDFPWRKKSRTNYEIVISEILLKRTRAETIDGYYFRFIKEYPSWLALSKTSEEELQEILKPIGLWRQRATALLSLAKAVRKRGGRVPSTREELEVLPGVGQYVANATLTICHGEREPLIDVNMARVLARFFGLQLKSDVRYDPDLQQLSRDVLPWENVKEFNWAVLDYAAVICKAREPRCNQCSLAKKCHYFNKNGQRKLHRI